MSRHVCFSPVIDSRTNVLVLGSFPGGESLRTRQYYAHPQNQFWRLVSDIVGVDLSSLAYENRLESLLAHGAGLWDVIASCQRKGSLDTSIRLPVYNDFSTLQLPRLRAVCCNGRKSFDYARKAFFPKGVPVILLPSSSPAHASLSYSKKLLLWREAFVQP